MARYKRCFLEGHSVFITVVTHRRNPILIDNIDLLRDSFSLSKSLYRYRIDAIVILPDHFHMIITPEYSKDYPHIVRTIKQHFSKQCPPRYYKHLNQSFSRWKEGYRPVWQKKYYEHTIRNENDLHSAMNYIRNNPVKHGYVEQPEQWAYLFSTQHKTKP